ncbi:Transcription factor IIIB 60 kDa subunit [Smittium culicis]|uniref:B-related factor 1 n=1 Tax=Smittium culicis TaxID=133412 RepID=A0A1R1YHJ8_9FUNG|nr:Transcription factor IIIB 60 kDa subunit [Smittium culicis]
MRCNGCGGNSIEHDTASGTSFCMQCGLVVEENTIVSDITFAENSAGATVIVGNLVNAGSTRTVGKGIGKHGYNSSSRDNTLYDAKRKILAIATALRLSLNYVESAQRYYHLSLNSGFTRGRKKNSVAACCLYIVCRMEKSSQMLIDFSDILQINVFKLGVTFVRLVRNLNLIIPLIDPSLYIYRFASMLDLGDKTQAVALDALRLVQRMDRDWIQTGRRPAGICGACLLIASRMHNFRRTEQDIIPVVKVSVITLKKRLDEFKKTPASRLSMADFRKVWLEKMADPPSYTNNRLKNKRLAKIKESNHLDFCNDKSDLDFDNNTVVEYFIKSMKIRKTPNIESNNNIIEAMYKDSITYSDDESTDPTDKKKNKFKSQEPLDKDVVAQILNNERKKYSHLDPSNTSIIQNFDVDISKWEDFDDSEIENCLLTSEEVEEKTKIWTNNNKEYLELQELKKLFNEKTGNNDDTDKPKPKKKKSARVGHKQGETALESTKNMLASKKLSKKINYDVLDTLFELDVTPPNKKLKKEEKVNEALVNKVLDKVSMNLDVVTPSLLAKNMTITTESTIDSLSLSQNSELEALTQVSGSASSLEMHKSGDVKVTLNNKETFESDNTSSQIIDDLKTQVNEPELVKTNFSNDALGDFDDEDFDDEEEEEIGKDEDEFANSARFALGYDDDGDYGNDYEEYD